LGIWITALFWSPLAFGQIGPLSIGAKVGVPLSDAFEFSSPATCDSTAKPVCSILNYSSKTKRYTFGPTVEWRLPYGLGIEFDALYNRLNYDSYFFSRTPSSGELSAFTSTGADRWNFPILLKWRHNLHRVSPFVDGGIAFDHISRVRSNFTGGTTSNAPELTNPNSEGFVAGGGIDVHPVSHIHLMPEIRYTRWFSENFHRAPGPVFDTNLNETTFLVGITF
jgi:opacity protein-like surface antigen